MFDGLQILSNTTKHDKTAPNKVLVMVFSRQTIPVWTGLKRIKDPNLNIFRGTMPLIPPYVFWFSVILLLSRKF